MPSSYSAKEILKILKRAGFVIISQKGSHIKLRGIREGSIHTVIVPEHRTIAKGTFSSILKQAVMTKDEFETYRKK